MTSFAITNPLASTVLTTVEYTPLASAVANEFANVKPGVFRCVKVGPFIRVLGTVDYDVAGAALGDQICELTMPPLAGIVDAIGFGVTVNAAGVGGAAGSGVCSVGLAVDGKMKLVCDAQAFVASGYVVRVDVLLVVLDV